MAVFPDSYLLLPPISAFIIYVASLAFDGLFFRPLVKFPGPRLAALIRDYEA